MLIITFSLFGLSVLRSLCTKNWECTKSFLIFNQYAWFYVQFVLYCIKFNHVRTYDFQPYMSIENDS